MQKILIGVGAAAAGLIVVIATIFLAPRFIDRLTRPQGPGAHLVLEADLASYWRDVLRRSAAQLGEGLRADGIAFSDLSRTNDAVSVRIADPAAGRLEVERIVGGFETPFVVSEPQPGLFRLTLIDGYRRASEERVLNRLVVALRQRGDRFLPDLVMVRWVGAR